MRIEELCTGKRILTVGVTAPPEIVQVATYCTRAYNTDPGALDALVGMGPYDVIVASEEALADAARRLLADDGRVIVLAPRPT